MSNKLSIECMEEFTELLRSKTDDDSCHSVVLAGGDKFFCAGGELGDFRKKTSVEVKKFGNAFITMHLAMQYFPKPIVAAVEADAFGGGFSLVEACDLAVGAKDALFAVPEMATGLPPAMGFSGIYANVPKKTAMALGLMSKKLTAEQALEYGLLNEVALKNKVVARAMELAHYFDDKNPTSIRLFKEMYRDMGFLAYERRLRIGEGCMLATFKSADGQEVLTAQEEGRSPVWVNN
jgi:enoyl-CoA hydratase/carnithine racemase